MNPDFFTQKTIERPATASGVGVHSGREIMLRLEPAPEDSGIVFVRADLPGEPEVPVSPRAVRADSLVRMTVLESPDGARGAVVGMTEHLLSACAGMGVTNLRVAIDGPECPIFDGSALPYVELLRRAGLRKQGRPARRWRLKRMTGLTSDGGEIVAIPAERPRLTFFGEFRHAGLPDQRATFESGSDDYAREVAPARTFAFYDEIEKLRAAGLIRGGSLDCALVLREGRLVQGEYRLKDELARHKLLDLMGDLALLGGPVLASISARASGHRLHCAFVMRLMEELEEACGEEKRNGPFGKTYNLTRD